MKDLIVNIIIGIFSDLILNGVPYLIFKNKYDNMDVIFIISAAIILLIVLAISIFLNKLKRYTHAQNIQTFTHLSIIQDILITHPEIANEYNRDIEGMKKLNPINLKTLNDLFIFNKGSNYKELINDLMDKINKSIEK